MDRVLRRIILMGLLLPSLLSLATGHIQTLDPEKAITQLLHDVWGFDEGLPQNTVQVVLQSIDGYLWLGTEEGLARFDGRDFVIFDRSNTPALEQSHNVLALYEDSEGTLWIGTDGGGLVRYTDGVFTPFDVDTGPKGENVSTIAQSMDGTLWIGTWEAGLFACTRFGCDNFGEDAGLSSKIQTIEVDDSGAVWIGTSTGLVVSPPGSTRTFEYVDGLRDDFVQTIYLDRSEVIWVGTHAGLFRIDDGTATRLGPEDGWPSEIVWAITQDRTGSLWFGLDQAGLVRFHENRFDAFTPADGLSAERVLSLVEDREGSLWIGMAYGGLNRLRDAAFTTWSESEGLAGDAVTTIFEDSQGTVWVGTFGGGVSRLRNGSVESITTADGLSSDVITSVSEDGRGNLWIGTLDDGLNRLRNGRILNYSTSDGLTSNSIYALYTSSDGSLWVGTGDGLNRIDDSGITSYTVEDGLSEKDITAIAEDSSGAIWIGTYSKGLNRLNNGRFTHFTTDDGLGSNKISALHIDESGTIWIGTRGGGLTRYTDGQFLTFTRRDGLFDDIIFQILEDDYGYLWMGCNRGVFRIAKSEFDDVARGISNAVHSDVFGTDDGLKSREINGGVQPAGWKGRDGRLWFPSVAGAAVIDPGDLRRNEIVPPVLIQEVLVDNVPANLRGAMELAPGMKRIEFHYAGLSLIDPEAVRYRYRLEGYEDEWVAAGDQRAATFTNVDPGTYIFHVTAMNNDGVWNESGAILAFTVAPFYYQTALFWILIAGLIIGLVVVGHAVRVRNLTLRKRQLEEMVETRTRDLQAAKKLVEAKTEELKNSLREKDVLLREVHHRVKNNLQMISSLLQLQSKQIRDPKTRALFQECRDRIYSISMIHERLYQSDELAELDFKGYLKGITEQLLRSYDLTQDHINLVVETDVSHLDVDQAIPCGLIVTELVSNALRHAFVNGETGNLSVIFTREDSHYLMNVEDDGCGLPPGFEPGVGNSLGLSLVVALVDRLGGEFQATDLCIDGKKGSLFQVTFPVDRYTTSSVAVDEIAYT